MNSVERYYQKKKKRKKRARILFFSLLFVLLTVTLGILSVTVFFNAETITVEGNTHYTAEQLLEQGGLSVGQNLFRLDKFKVIQRMCELPYVKEVTIRRRLPHTLRVEVAENKPVVWVPAPDGSAALLNENYRVLEFVPLPRAESTAEPTDEPAEDGEEPEKDGEEPAEEPGEEPALGVPKLEAPESTELIPGGIAAPGGEDDYSGFLERLYTAFSHNPDLDWSLVDTVYFYARYDIQLLYNGRITVDLGTLDQADTKLELAAYLLQDNSLSQAATLDVRDVERVYYRPKS